MEFDGLLDAASAVFVFGGITLLALAMRLRVDGLRLIYEVSLPLGLVGFLIGIISLLAAASNPTQVAPALAIALLTVAYAGGVRILFADTASLSFATEASSPLAKASGSAVILAMMCWAMYAVTGGEVAIYAYPQVALFLGGVAVLLFFVGRALGENYRSGWAAKLMSIGWLGFLCGVVGGLQHLENHQALGPAIAFSFMSLLYTLVVLILGLIWLPSTMSARDGSLSLGFGFGAAVSASVVGTLAVLVSVLA
jgi:hypothetical protein